MASTYNPVIRNNATWEINLTLTNADGSPFDLSLYTGESQIKNHDKTQVLATLEVTVTDATHGKLRAFLPLDVAQSLLPTPTAIPPRTPLPVWDVIISNADQSSVWALVEGNVTVKSGVTQWE